MHSKSPRLVTMIQGLKDRLIVHYLAICRLGPFLQGVKLVFIVWSLVSYMLWPNYSTCISHRLSLLWCFGRDDTKGAHNRLTGELCPAKTLQVEICIQKSNREKKSVRQNVAGGGSDDNSVTPYVHRSRLSTARPANLLAN